MLGVKVLVTAGVTLPVVDGVKEIVLLTEILNDILGVIVEVAVGVGVVLHAGQYSCLHDGVTLISGLILCETPKLTPLKSSNAAIKASILIG